MATINLESFLGDVHPSLSLTECKLRTVKDDIPADELICGVVADILRERNCAPEPGPVANTHFDAMPKDLCVYPIDNSAHLPLLTLL